MKSFLARLIWLEPTDRVIRRAGGGRGGRGGVLVLVVVVGGDVAGG